MAKTQQRLKECVEKQSLDSLERLSGLLEPSIPVVSQEPMEEDSTPAIDASETTGSFDPRQVRGENKVPVSKRSTRRKHQLSRKDASASKPPKAKPKYYCEF